MPSLQHHGSQGLKELEPPLLGIQMQDGGVPRGNRQQVSDMRDGRLENLSECPHAPLNLGDDGGLIVPLFHLKGVL